MIPTHLKQLKSELWILLCSTMTLWRCALQLNSQLQAVAQKTAKTPGGYFLCHTLHIEWSNMYMYSYQYCNFVKYTVTESKQSTLQYSTDSVRTCCWCFSVIKDTLMVRKPSISRTRSQWLESGTMHCCKILKMSLLRSQQLHSSSTRSYKTRITCHGNIHSKNW